MHQLDTVYADTPHPPRDLRSQTTVRVVMEQASQVHPIPVFATPEAEPAPILSAPAASQFTGTIPQNYDEGLGPYLFEDFARDLAYRVAAKHPRRVLELAAGTGILSRKLRDVLPPATELIVTDLNTPMLDLARAKFKPEENVYFDQIDAMQIRFPDNSFDVVVCQFGLMFFPDKPFAFAEAKRVLTHDGFFLFNTWGSMAQNPYSRIAQESSSRFFPPDAPSEFYQTPFSYSDPNIVTRDMVAGGFHGFDHENVDVQKQIPDFALLARGLVRGNPLVTEIRAIGVQEHEVMHAVENDLREVFQDGLMPLRAITFEGWF